jgi:hypothetical protein
LPPAIERLVATSPHLVTAYDRELTAVRWNALADSLWQFGRARSRFELNSIWSMFKQPDRRLIFGAGYDRAARHSASTLRWLLAHSASQFVTDLFSEVSGEPAFRAHWERYEIATGPEPKSANEPLILTHPQLGDLSLYGVEMAVAEIPNVDLVMHVPADQRSEDLVRSIGR